ncbi:hypothetical protein LA080_007656 [Diaporthe eres]|nr:hypothetical protein LA080_007656 [Diaporthe eres]
MISLQSPTSVVPIPVGATSPDTWARLEKAETQIRRPRAAVPSVPAALFAPKIHPRVAEVTAQVDAFFLKHWPFESDKARKKFAAAGFSAVTCLYFPDALDERIAFACRLLALLFLVDDLLEDMSLEDGSAYNERLILLSRGTTAPDRSIPVEWITYDLWNEMRICDKALADEILEPVFTFMRAQTDKSRLDIKELGEYFKYRERDVGKAMNLHVTPEELQSIKDIEMNCSKHISVVNDIYSWEKELKASQTGHKEGSALCSSVSVLSAEANLEYSASKRVLWAMCREWEFVHDELVAKRLSSTEGCSTSLSAFMKGLEYQMSGNEAWSETTPRYHSV